MDGNGISYVIFIVGMARAGTGIQNGEWDGYIREYLKEFQLDVDPAGRGIVQSTTDFRQAKKFPSKIAAFEFWNQQSKKAPRRPDGEPNKPLTAYTVEIIPYGTRPVYLETL